MITSVPKLIRLALEHQAIRIYGMAPSSYTISPIFKRFPFHAVQEDLSKVMASTYELFGASTDTMIGSHQNILSTCTHRPGISVPKAHQYSTPGECSMGSQRNDTQAIKPYTLAIGIPSIIPTTLNLGKSHTLLTHKLSTWAVQPHTASPTSEGMAGIGLEVANLVATCLEIFLYGLYLVLFGATIQLMKNRRTSISIALWIGIVFLFILSTVHIAITIRRFANAYIVFREVPGPTAYYSNQTDWLSITSLSIYGISTLVGDCLVVWRCFIIWGRKWWIVFFFGTLICALEVCGVNVMIKTSHLTSAEEIFELKIPEWFSSFVIISMSNNVLVSGLMTYRLLTMSRDMGISLGARHGRRYQRLAMIMLESASIYPLCLIIYLIIYRSGSQAHWIMNTIMVQILAIVPCLMVIAVLTNKREETTAFRSTVGPSGNQWLSKLRATGPSTLNTQNLDGDNRSDGGFKLRELPPATKIVVDTSTTINYDDDSHHEDTAMRHS